MSLLVWLPLNGALENLGLSPTKFSVVNSSSGLTTSSTGGKVVPGLYKRTARTADYIISDTNFLLDGDFSMCCWCKVTGISDSGTANGIITQYGHLTGGSGITMKDVSSTDLRMSINTGTNDANRTYCTYYGSTNIYNAWHHLCVTYDRSESRYRMYVDGNPETIVGYGDSVIYGDNAVPRPFCLFAWSTDHLNNEAYRPPCELNDVRLYDHCLSTKEIKEISKGLVAHYQLKGGYESTREPDCSGYGNHATKVGTLNISSDSPRYSGAYIFPNSSYVACGRGAMVQDAITVACWGYMDNWSSMTGQLVSCTEGGGWGLGYGANTAGHGFELYSNGYYGVDLAFTNLSTGWHHFAATYNGNTIIGYVDGVEKSRKTGVNTGIGYHTSNGIFIGAEAGSSETTAAGAYFNGRISDVRIYGTALSASDILDMYKHNVCLTKDGKLFANVFNESDSNSIEKTGTVTTNSFNLKNVPTYDMKIKALDDGSTWARINHLNVTNDKTFFANDSEVAKCTDKNNRYSRMGDVDKYKSSDGSYEFMLTYPSMKKTVPAGYVELEYIESTGTQWINTGVTGHARWEFDIQFMNTTKRQLMGYWGSQDEYWGSQTDGKYGLFTGSTIGESGNRDTIVHDFQQGAATLWVENQTHVIGGYANLGSHQYQLFGIMDGDASYTCHARLYRCKCIQNGSLIRDFIPAMRSSDGVIGLIDVVNSVFYTNAGSGTFVAGYKKGYQWLDYIENATGTEYINTGFAAPEGFITEAVVEYLNYAGGYFVGSHNISAPYGRNGVGINTVGWEIGTGDTCPNSPSLPTLNTKYNVKASTVKGNSYIDLNGTRVVSTNDSSSRCTDNLYVFYNQYSLYHGHATSRVRIYSLKIYQPDGALVRNYLPCINPEGKIGLYDKVTGVFYKNVGAGQLISGTTQNSVPLYNRWIQASSPNSAANTGTGFKAINTAWTNYFAPITKSASSESATYSMNLTNNWWAPVGQKVTFGGGIPAADDSTQYETELWVRTDRFSDANQFKIYDGSMVATDYIEF